MNKFQGRRAGESPRQIREVIKGLLPRKYRDQRKFSQELSSSGSFHWVGMASLKTKPILKRIKDGKKIAMKKKINIGFPILFQIYVFYLNGKF